MVLNVSNAKKREVSYEKVTNKKNIPKETENIKG